MVLHVRASCHQGDSRFQGRGKQCTAMAMRALAHHSYKNISLWTTQDMDHILQDGDNLYIQAASTHDISLLLPSEAIQFVNIENVSISMNVEGTCNGLLRDIHASQRGG